MKVVVVAGQKGGIGKSTIACNLAVCAANAGNKTLLADCDPQGSSVKFRTVREAGDFTAMSMLEPTIHKDIGTFTSFDYICVDAGGRDNSRLRSAVMAAAEGILLVPVLPSAYDIWSTRETFDILKDARVYTDIKAYAVFNRTIANTNVSKEAKEELEKLLAEYDVGMISTVLYSRVDYSQSIGEGLGVIEYKPKDKAAEEFTSLYNEIENLFKIGG